MTRITQTKLNRKILGHNFAIQTKIQNIDIGHGRFIPVRVSPGQVINIKKELKRQREKYYGKTKI